MHRRRRAWLLVACSSGLLFAGTCDAVVETIKLAFDIVNVWV